jgi:hypothetical protein
MLIELDEYYEKDKKTSKKCFNLAGFIWREIRK